LPEVKRDTRDIIGASLGMSGKTFEKAKAVVAAHLFSKVFFASSVRYYALPCKAMTFYALFLCRTNGTVRHFPVAIVLLIATLWE